MAVPVSADLLAQIRVHGAVPRHVAIIMDGNGRWARDRMLPRPLGHRSGMKAVRDVVEGAIEAGVEVLSLMSLLEEYIQKEADELDEQGVQVRVLGELERLTPPAAAAVERVVTQTAHNTTLRLNLFISYGSRAELARAARLLAEDVMAGRIAPSEIDEKQFAQRLFTHDCPDPDLLIRTSGEQRISNFLLWQVAYAELYISSVLWPDFGRRELFEAILDFQHRDRRFGRVPA
jgi:undecaprenyl diphosphate synthase